MSQLKIKNGNSWESIPAGGIGVPSGGTTGQVLKKSSNTDYATEWATQRVINPPDMSKRELTTVTNNALVTVTSVGGWYWGVAQTGNTSMTPYVLIANVNDNADHYAGIHGDTGAWKKASTAPIYFEAGFQFTVQIGFNYQPSGLYYAPPLE